MQMLVCNLRRFICDGRFQNGEKLPAERSLAQSMGVSRTSLRKAIQVLAAQGVLESRQGDGTYIRDAAALAGAPAEKDALRVFADILEARGILEPEIAELACLRRTQEQLDQLKIITCDQQRRLLTGQDDGDLDASFHYWLALSSGNAVLAEIMKMINELYEHSRAPELRDKEWRQFSVDTHLRIIDALEQRSVEKCRAAIEAHLRAVILNHPFVVDKQYSQEDL